MYNVITVTCKVTGLQYVGVRTETAEKLRQRFIGGQAEGNSAIADQSVKTYGIDAHDFKVIASFSDVDDATILRLLMIKGSPEGKTLSSKVLPGYGFRLVDTGLGYAEVISD